MEEATLGRVALDLHWKAGPGGGVGIWESE